MNKLKFKFLRTPRSPGGPPSPRRAPLSPRGLLSPRRLLSPSPTNRGGGPSCSPGGGGGGSSHGGVIPPETIENDSLRSIDPSFSSHSSRDDDISTDSATIDSAIRDSGPIDCDTLRKHRLKVRTKVRGDCTMSAARLPQIAESPSSGILSNSSSRGGLLGSYPEKKLIDNVAPHHHPDMKLVDGSTGLALLRSKISFKRVRSQSNPNLSATFDHQQIDATNSDLDAHTAANVHIEPATTEHQVGAASACLQLKVKINSTLSSSSLALGSEDKYTTSLSSSGETQESTFINGIKNSNLLTDNNKVDKYSPSSVICMFDSIYPVELDPEGTSHDESESATHHQEPYRSDLLLPDIDGCLAAPSIAESLSTKCSDEDATATAVQYTGQSASVQYPAIESQNTSTPLNAMRREQSALSDEDSSSIYTDTVDEGPKVDKYGALSVPTIIASSGKETKSSTSTSNKEFLELKKVAEKNEFKVVVALKKNSTALPTLTNLASSSSEGTMDKYMGKSELIDDLSKLVDEKQMQTEIPQDLIATISHSTSSTPESAFPDDSMVSSLSPSHPSTVSTSIEQDYERVQGSLSTDSDTESYMSLTSIGDITICDETKRLLEAQALYAEDAKTNSNHPARQKKSAMRVGSIFKSLENSSSDDCPSIETVPASSAPSSAPSASSLMTKSLCRIRALRLLSSKSKAEVSAGGCIMSDEASQQRVKLSWYDEEVNRNKPFTLRTDEIFDASSIMSTTSSQRTKGLTEYNVMDQFLGDFINGLCSSRGDVDFDLAEQEEI